MPGRKQHKYLPPPEAAGPYKNHSLVTTFETNANPTIRLPPTTEERPAPAQGAGMESLLTTDDVTKLLSGVMPRLALQGDGPLREPSPRQQGILCAVVNH